MGCYAQSEKMQTSIKIERNLASHVFIIFSIFIIMESRRAKRLPKKLPRARGHASQPATLSPG
jgi:hypothetical protein